MLGQTLGHFILAVLPLQQRHSLCAKPCQCHQQKLDYNYDSGFFLWQFFSEASLRRALVLLLILAGSTALAQTPRTRPFAQDEVRQLITGGVASQRIVALIDQLGIEFEPTDEVLEGFRAAGADQDELNSLRGAGAKWYLRHGREFCDKGQAAEAERDARAALHLAPDLTAGHLLLGDALLLKDDADGALAEYREVLRREPESPEGHTGLCGALQQKNELDAAVPACRNAVRLGPNQFWAHFWLGTLLVRKGDQAGALTELREALRIWPDSAEAHSGSCWALRSKGDTDGAMVECREALRLAPQNPLVLVQVGETFMAKSDFAGAEAEYREALRLKPDLFYGKVGLCWALASKNELDAAMAACQDAVRQKPGDPWGHHTLGWVWEKKGDAAAALAEYRTAYLTLPQDPILSGDYDRLLHQSQQKVVVGPRKGEARELLEKGAFAQAEQEYRQLLQQEPLNREYQFGLGDALQGQARYREATSVYSQAGHGPAVYRINAGGSYKDSQGCQWEGDRYFDAGAVSASSRQVEGTSDSALFRSNHYHRNLLQLPLPFQFSFPVTNGDYRVNIYFAEVFAGALLMPTAQSPGRRVMRVSINGTMRFQSLDIFAEAGGFQALVKSARVHVTGGTLTILFSFAGGKYGPEVSAIEVIAAP
jgi:tetratricopeptide (TPR) repeat protein